MIGETNSLRARGLLQGNIGYLGKGATKRRAPMRRVLSKFLPFLRNFSDVPPIMDLRGLYARKE